MNRPYEGAGKKPSPETSRDRDDSHSLALICEADESVPAGSEGVDTCPVPVVVAGKPLKPPVDDMVAIAVPVESELPKRKHQWRPNAAM